MEHVQQLMQQKQELEARILTLSASLQASGGVDAPLVDAEGFPRGDIDVYKTRLDRVKLIEWRNDLKALMKQIEVGLVEMHRQHRQTRSTPAVEEERPFAYVKAIAPDSPAWEGGLRRNDRILSIGPIRTASRLHDLPQFVHKGQPLHVHISRDNTLLALTIVPNTWEGQGLLGCLLVPL
jgi:26S proteasome non-ATPase regulatory subunit 9